MSEISHRLGVAAAKRHFTELIDRVGSGEEVIVCRHGKPVLKLSEPGSNAEGRQRPVGLAAVAGVMSDWDELPAVVDEIYRARLQDTVRDIPELGK